MHPKISLLCFYSVAEVFQLNWFAKTPHPPAAPSPQGEGQPPTLPSGKGWIVFAGYFVFLVLVLTDMVYITKSFQGILNFGAKREIFENAKELRKSQTEAEKVLWEAVRSRRLDGLKIRRQHPVKQFILDFYCHEYLLGIEIDGSVHESDEAKEYDLNRTAELENLGITMLRFKNEEVQSDLTKVITEIRDKVRQIENLSIQ